MYVPNKMIIMLLGLLTEKSAPQFPIVTKSEWGGRPPASITQLNHPVPYVVVHHSSSPAACYTSEDCQRAMRSMQDYHQFTPRIMSFTAPQFPIVTKSEWGGRPPASITQLNHPVPYVVVHHSSSPAACYTSEDCQRAMRSMQDYHQFTPRIMSFTAPQFPIVTKSEWGGRPPASITQLNHPVPYVVVHHSSSPAACYTSEDCQRAMRSMQDYHQFTQQWDDIGYNFGVGGDGLVCEGRGWDYVGAHAPPYNNVSIGIVFIGHWVSELPPRNQLQAAKNLITVGIELGYIDPNYTLIGHRQARATECPGEALFKEISTWEHFDSRI